MQSYLPEIWIVVGIICILLEFVIPGALIVFLGISALITGILLKIGLPIDYGIPFIVFMVLSAAQIIFLRKHLKSWFTGKTIADDQDGLEEFVGKDATVIKGFEDGSEKGTVDFKGAQWNAIADKPLKPGEEVTITKQKGITLYVSPKQ